MTDERRPEPRRVLLIRLSHLGDVVHALPAFHAIRRRWPSAELGWAVEASFAPLLDGLPGLDRRFLFDRRAGWRAFLRSARSIRRWAPDLSLDVQGNLKSAAVGWLAGAPARLGPAATDWREHGGRLALTDHAPPSTARHAAARVADWARWACGTDRTAVDLDLGLSTGERAQGRAQLAQLLPGDAAPVILQLGREGDPRSLPTATSREAAELLVAAGAPVLVLSGPAEAEVGRRLERDLPPVDGVLTHLSSDDPRAAAALMWACAQRGGVFVGSDSGPLHLACAAGLRCVAVAGPQDPERTGPWPTTRDHSESHHAVLWADPRPDCAPCLSRRCKLPEGPICTVGIRPEQVVAAALALRSMKP
jgi:heptosyltransferase-1